MAIEPKCTTACASNTAQPINTDGRAAPAPCCGSGGASGPGVEQTTFGTVAGGNTFNIPGGGVNLVAWSVRAIGTGVTVSISGSPAVTLTDNEIVESTAQHGNILTDNVVVTTTDSSTVRVLYRQRS